MKNPEEITTEEIESVEECPNCKSEAIGYDDFEGFFECFQCYHNWTIEKATT